MMYVDNVNFQDADNNTPLHKSVRTNQSEEVKNLLKKGADASLANSNGNTPLHDAVVKKYHQIVEVILKYSNRDTVKRIIDATTLENNSTALHIAASNGCYESVSCLLSYGANFEVKNNNGSRPIDLAKDNKVKELLVNVELDSKLAAVGNYEMLESRFHQYNRQNDLAASSYARNGESMTSLQMAVMNNHCNTVRAIVDARVELRRRYYENKTDQMIDHIDDFIEHAKKSSEHSSSLMLHSKDIKKIGGDSMAHKITETLSAAYNIVKITEKVFKHDNDEPYEQSGLLAVIEETLEVLQFEPEYVNCDNSRNIILRRNKARYYKMLRINAGEDENFNDFEEKTKIMSYMGILEVAITRNIVKFMGRIFSTKLVEAARDNDLEMFYECIEGQFVDVNLYLKGTDCRTPLIYAVENGNEEMVFHLLEKNADVMWPTKSNIESALYLAAKYGHLGIVKLLLQKSGDDSNADLETFKEGWTPVHIAAKTSRLDILKCLLEHSAIYDTEDRNGQIPVELSNNILVTEFLNWLDELFEMAETGNLYLLTKLKALTNDELLVVCNARDSTCRTIAEVAEYNGQPGVAMQISKMIKKIAPFRKPKGFLDDDERFREIKNYQLIQILKASKT